MPANETSRVEEPPVLSDEEQAFRDQEAEYEAEARARLVRREEHLENFRRLVRPVAPELVERATQIHDADEFSMPFDAHERGGRVIVTFADIGNGVASSWDVTAFVYRGGQRTLQMSYGGFDGSYVQPLELDAPIDAALRADVEHVFETQLATGPRDPRFGLADLFVSAQQGAATRSGNGFAAVGPLYISRPRPASFPLQAAEGRSFTPDMLLERGGRLMRVVPVETECEEVVVGAHRLRHCGLAGRNGGVAVALMSGANVGEWALETRNAVLGGALEWAGEHQGWLFGYFGHSHPGGRYAGAAGIVALRASDGAVFRIDVDGVFERGYDLEHWDREARLYRRQEACFEAELQRRDITEADEDVYEACAFTEHPLALDERGLLVTRADGSIVRVDFDKLMRVLRHVSTGP